ncbi:heterogeneous nuclear ribonucleoprotein L isoform X2 [Rhynchophorus ferrugineus]|uniref:heterogeneous nuclear ribonucleoprotein L isoform X2 n=1 Tax=Rhynchophorus ferrugineus TaxID=354439 RepID=UPI003FCDFF3D
MVSKLVTGRSEDRVSEPTLNSNNIIYNSIACLFLRLMPEKLNVHKNDSESWDYTVSLIKENTNGRPQPLLQEPHFGSRPQPYNPYPSDPHRYEDICNTGTGPGGYPHDAPPFGPGAVAAAAADVFRKSGTAPQSTAPDFRTATEARALPFQQPGAVLMVYGLDPLRTNADKLFNLMCLYGNVARIKFLKSKEGTAMVQMGDSVAVERCVQNLNNVTVGLTGAAPLVNRQNGSNQDQMDTDGDGRMKEHKLQLAFSKQPYLSEVTNPYPLPDKSPSYKEYLNNKNNRFMNPAMASKNRIQPPSKILHFFNTPPQVTEAELIQVFKDYDVVPPKAVKLFPMKSERSSSGLLEFETTTEAVAAVMACNHAAIESPGTKFPFIMKLCFSSSRSMTIKNGDNANGSTTAKDDGKGPN